MDKTITLNETQMKLLSEYMNAKSNERVLYNALQDHPEIEHNGLEWQKACQFTDSVACIFSESVAEAVRS